ncbi:MAG: glycosyltransferase [Rubrivivax sp.]|nr:glycosyltransferase [Rubrivivax sp.]
MHLRALLRMGRVHVLYAGDGEPIFDKVDLPDISSVVSLKRGNSRASPPANGSPARSWRRFAVDAWGLSGWLSAPGRSEADTIRRTLLAENFDVVFAFHIGSALVADAVLKGTHVQLRAIDWDFLESPSIVHWAARGSGQLGTLRRISAEFNAWKLRRLERRIMLRWPLQFCSSEFDVPLLQGRTAGHTILAIDNPCFAPPQPMPVSVDGPPTALFVGTMAYWPNELAARHLLSEIWPSVRRVIPDARLCVVGRAMPASIERYGGRDGVSIHANVPDLEPYYRRAHVALAPLRHVVGSNLKIPEAMAHARPVVGYESACVRAGVGITDGVFAASTAAQFCEHVLNLLSDLGAAAIAGAAAWRSARARLQSESLEAKLSAAIDEAMKCKGRQS